jgi:ActR/RegA family two-component response regulator
MLVKEIERADMLASEASVQAGAVKNRSDILNALWDIGRSNDSVQYSVSKTMDRLQDLHIQRGISKHEHHVGVTKRLINQHMTGTISVYTLRNLIQERNDMVWTCVNC